MKNWGFNDSIACEIKIGLKNQNHLNQMISFSYMWKITVTQFLVLPDVEWVISFILKNLYLGREMTDSTSGKTER